MPRNCSVCKLLEGTVSLPSKGSTDPDLSLLTIELEEVLMIAEDSKIEFSPFSKGGAQELRVSFNPLDN